MKKIYVTGAMFGQTIDEMEENVREIEEAASWVANEGFGAVQIASFLRRYFDSWDQEVMINQALANLTSCDAVLVVSGCWPECALSQAAIAGAEMMGVPVFYSDAALLEWATEPDVANDVVFSSNKSGGGMVN